MEQQSLLEQDRDEVFKQQALSLNHADGYAGNHEESRRMVILRSRANPGSERAARQKQEERSRRRRRENASFSRAKIGEMTLFEALTLQPRENNEHRDSSEEEDDESVPIPLVVKSKEIRALVSEKRLREYPYFQRLLDGPWTAEGDAVLDFPSIRMLDAFWLVLCCAVSPLENPVKSVPLGFHNCIQVHSAACMIGHTALMDHTEEFIIANLTENVFFRAFRMAEHFHRQELKRGLFRWLCYSGRLHRKASTQEDGSVPSMYISADGNYLIYNGQNLVSTQFYDILKLEIGRKRPYFIPWPTAPSSLQFKLEFDKHGAYACHLERRRVSGPIHNSTHFILRSEASNEIIMAACHIEGSSEFTFASSYPSSFARTDPDFLGYIECNFLGTTFIIYDHGIKAQDPAALAFPELVQGEHGAIIYQPNVLGRVPNSMTVLAPDRRRDLPPGPSLVKRYESSSLDGIFQLHTVKPIWNESTQTWKMDFGGRVETASKKNFKLQRVNGPNIQDPSKDWLMLFGKVSKHRFSLDFKYPLTVVQAMSIAMTTFADKLLVC